MKYKIVEGLFVLINQQPGEVFRKKNGHLFNW